MHYFPVDILIIEYRYITKAHGFFQTAGQFISQHALLRQQIKSLPHGVWGPNFHTCNQMRADIHRDLHRTTEIERNDVLKINVRNQRGGIFRAL